MRRTGKNSMLRKVRQFDTVNVTNEMAKKICKILDKYSETEVRNASAGAGTFFVWVSTYSFSCHRTTEPEPPLCLSTYMNFSFFSFTFENHLYYVVFPVRVMVWSGLFMYYLWDVNSIFGDHFWIFQIIQGNTSLLVSVSSRAIQIWLIRQTMVVWG